LHLGGKPLVVPKRNGGGERFSVFLDFPANGGDGKIRAAGGLFFFFFPENEFKAAGEGEKNKKKGGGGGGDR